MQMYIWIFAVVLYYKFIRHKHCIIHPCHFNAVMFHLCAMVMCSFLIICLRDENWCTICVLAPAWAGSNHTFVNTSWQYTKGRKCLENQFIAISESKLSSPSGQSEKCSQIRPCRVASATLPQACVFVRSHVGETFPSLAVSIDLSVSVLRLPASYAASSDWRSHFPPGRMDRVQQHAQPNVMFEPEAKCRQRRSWISRSKAGHLQKSNEIVEASFEVAQIWHEWFDVRRGQNRLRCHLESHMMEASSNQKATKMNLRRTRIHRYHWLEWWWCVHAACNTSTPPERWPVVECKSFCSV